VLFDENLTRKIPTKWFELGLGMNVRSTGFPVSFRNIQHVEIAYTGDRSPAVARQKRLSRQELPQGSRYRRRMLCDARLREAVPATLACIARRT
jgi:hypothetical protein